MQHIVIVILYTIVIFLLTVARVADATPWKLQQKKSYNLHELRDKKNNLTVGIYKELSLDLGIESQDNSPSIDSGIESQDNSPSIDSGIESQDNSPLMSKKKSSTVFIHPPYQHTKIPASVLQSQKLCLKNRSDVVAQKGNIDSTLEKAKVLLDVSLIPNAQKRLKSQADRQVQKIINNGLCPLVRMRKNLNNNPLLNEIDIYRPLLNTAPNQDISKDIGKLLKKAKKDGRPLSVSEKIQIVDTIALNGWHYNQDDICNIPVNNDLTKLNLVQMIDPKIGYQSIYTMDYTCQLKYFNFSKNSIEELDVTTKLVELGSNFKMQTIQKVEDGLTLQQIQQKEKENVLGELKGEIESKVLDSMLQQYKHDYNTYYDKIGVKNLETQFLTSSEIKNITKGKGMQLAYAQKKQMNKDAVVKPIQERYNTWRKNILEGKEIVLPFNLGSLVKQRTGYSQNIVDFREQLKKTVTEFNKGIFKGTKEDFIAKINDIILSLAAIEIEDATLKGYGDLFEYTMQNPYNCNRTVKYEEYERDVMNEARKRAVMAHILDLEQTYLKNGIRLTITKSDGTTDLIPVHEFNQLGSKITKNDTIQDLVPDKIDVSQVITPNLKKQSQADLEAQIRTLQLENRELKKLISSKSSSPPLPIFSDDGTLVPPPPPPLPIFSDDGTLVPIVPQDTQIKQAVFEMETISLTNTTKAQTRVIDINDENDHHTKDQHQELNSCNPKVVIPPILFNANDTNDDKNNKSSNNKKSFPALSSSDETDGSRGYKIAKNRLAENNSVVEKEAQKQILSVEEAKAMREQKAKESGIDSSTVIAGIDPILHNNIVADLRSEIIDLKEQLAVKSNEPFEVIGDLASNNHARGKRSLDKDQIVETKDQSTSTEDLTVLEDRLVDDKLENREFEEEEAVKKLDEVISRYSDSDIGCNEQEVSEGKNDKGHTKFTDTNVVVSEASLQSKPIVSEIARDEIAGIEKELGSQSLAEEEEVVEAVEDMLGQDIVTDTGCSGVGANSSTDEHQKVLTERAVFAARVREDLRFSSKAVSKQIRHRLLTREIGSMVAVAAGDEEEAQAPSYSVWSSGMFGGSKHEDIATSLGYNSRIRGGSIGGEINLSSDLMFGASLSRLHSTFKSLPMLNSNQNVSKTNTNIFNIYSSATFVENINLHSLVSIALSGKAAKQQDMVKPKSKLFSFESHLNQKITFQNNITLIPSIGIRYEYVRIGTSGDTILDSYILHHKKSKSSTLSGEVGARVLFTPIKISSDVKLIPTVHISLDKSIRGSKRNSGQLISIKDIGGEATTVAARSHANHEKLSTNIGGGLIANHKNMALEFLYDMQKQRSFKSHQGVLKLKVNL